MGKYETLDTSLRSRIWNPNGSTPQLPVSQAMVQSEQDVAYYHDKGFPYIMPPEFFSGAFPGMNPEHIWYSQSATLPCFYYNPATMAACPIHIVDILRGVPGCEEAAWAAIEQSNEQAARGDYDMSLETFPESKKLKYLKELAQVEPSRCPGYWDTFRKACERGRFGLSKLTDQELLDIIARRPAGGEGEFDLAGRAPDTPVMVFRAESADEVTGYAWWSTFDMAARQMLDEGWTSGFIMVAKVPASAVRAHLVDARYQAAYYLLLPSDANLVERIEMVSEEDAGGLMTMFGNRFQFYANLIPEFHYTGKGFERSSAQVAEAVMFSLLFSQVDNADKFDTRVLAEAALLMGADHLMDGLRAGSGTREMHPYFAQLTEEHQDTLSVLLWLQMDMPPLEQAQKLYPKAIWDTINRLGEPLACALELNRVNLRTPTLFGLYLASERQDSLALLQLILAAKQICDAHIYPRQLSKGVD